MVQGQADAVGEMLVSLRGASEGAAVYGSVSITVPAAGFVSVTASPTALSNGTCTTSCTVTHRLRHVQSGQTTVPISDTPPSVAATATYAAPAVTTVYAVSAGVNVFESLLSRSNGDGVIYGWYNSLTASYSPFGQAGGGTLALDGLAAPAADKAAP